MAGLLDWLNTPQGIGLLSGVAGYAAGARKGTPVNNIGRGMYTGLTGYQQAQDQIRQDADNKLAQQYRQMQIEELKRQQQARAAMTEASQAAYKQAYKPAVDAVAPITTYAPQMGGNYSLMGGYTAAMGGDLSQSPMLSQPEARPAPYAQPQPEAIHIPGREAQPGGFDQAAYREAMFNKLAQLGQPDDAFKYAPKEEEAFTLTPGQQRFKGNKVVAQVAPEPKQSGLAQLLTERAALQPGDPNIAFYDEAIKKAATHQPAATMNNYGSPVAGVGPDGRPVFFQPSKDNSAPKIVEGVTPPPREEKPFTAEENNAAGYLTRMRAAERLITQLDGGEKTIGTSVAASIPFVGSYAERKAMTPQQQKYKQAADDWIRAKLRKESGAVIGADEMDKEYITYFPQPGDSREVIAQKAASRRQADAQIEMSAGRAAPRMEQAAFTPAEMKYIETQKALGKSDAQIIEGLNRGMAGKTKILPRKSSVRNQADAILRGE